MKKLTLTAFLTGISFLILCCLFTNGNALTKDITETVKGKIEVNLPDAPVPQFEINLDESHLNSFVKSGVDPKFLGDKPIDPAEYAEMLKGASIQVYDKETKNLNQVVAHYHSVLENEKWERLIKIRNKFDLCLLYKEEPDDIIVQGIFLMFTDDANLGFVNIYGEIDLQKLSTLFRQLPVSNSEAAISETVHNWLNISVPEHWKVRLNLGKSDYATKSETVKTDR